jgi:ABC-type antimicrobial peptide transport system permease subunit
MSSLDLMLMGIKNLWRRKTRTVLTVLGVVIGTTAIVVMLSLGFGMQRAQEAEMEKMGGLTVIEVHKPWQMEEPGKKSEDKLYLDEETVETFKSLGNVTGVLATKNTQIQLKVGKKQSWSEVLAVDFEELQKFGYELQTGEWPGKVSKNTMIAGATTNMNFYDMNSRMSYGMEQPGEDLENGNVKCFLEGEYYGEGKKKRPFSIDVVGTLVAKENWQDNTSYMSFYSYNNYVKQNLRKYGTNDTSKRKKPGTKEDLYDSIKVKVDKLENVIAVQDQIKAMGFEAYSNAEYLEGNKNQTLIIQGVLGGIGGVSLLIAAIGITNTMIMSIYERTREIGVMKVLGAKLKDIKNLFLFEAAMIGLIGGFMGLGLSLGVSQIINKIFFNMTQDSYMAIEEISYIPFYLMASALVFATLIGIISGYYPARRAMKLSALKAISSN